MAYAGLRVKDTYSRHFLITIRFLCHCNCIAVSTSGDPMKYKTTNMLLELAILWSTITP